MVGHAGHTLTDAARLLPTPRTSDGRGPAVHGEGGNDLRTTVAYLPTPRASDGTKGCPAQRGSKGDLTLPSAAVTLDPDQPLSQPDQGELTPWGPYAAAVGRWAAILGRPAPSPTQPGTHAKPVLAPLFVEWLMGLPEQWVCGLGLPRTVALKLLGNGVVPHQAAAALRALLVRHHNSAVTP
jgi:DNA (cytosine-5)-methyltransferase 1